MNDAHDRFLQAVRAFQRAEEPARKDWASVDEKAFRRVIIDLDAAIPKLDPLSEGRATVLKASALYWIHMGQISARRMFDVNAKYPERTEAHQLAVKGLAILENSGATAQDLSWANDLVNKTK